MHDHSVKIVSVFKSIGNTYYNLFLHIHASLCVIKIFACTVCTIKVCECAHPQLCVYETWIAKYYH